MDIPNGTQIRVAMEVVDKVLDAGYKFEVPRLCNNHKYPKPVDIRTFLISTLAPTVQLEEGLLNIWGTILKGIENELSEIPNDINLITVYNAMIDTLNNEGIYLICTHNPIN